MQDRKNRPATTELMMQQGERSVRLARWGLTKAMQLMNCCCDPSRSDTTVLIFTILQLQRYVFSLVLYVYSLPVYICFVRTYRIRYDGMSPTQAKFEFECSAELSRPQSAPPQDRHCSVSHLYVNNTINQVENSCP